MTVAAESGTTPDFADIAEVADGIAANGYVTDQRLATTVFLMSRLADNGAAGTSTLAEAVPSEQPVVRLTSNNTRDLSVAPERRCLHLVLDYPSVERELGILRARTPVRATRWPAAWSRSCVELSSEPAAQHAVPAAVGAPMQALFSQVRTLAFVSELVEITDLLLGQRRSAVLVLGDARGNGNDPNLDAFAEITRQLATDVRVAG